MVQFREVSGLERFYIYSKYREQDLKCIQFREGSRLQKVQFIVRHCKGIVQLVVKSTGGDIVNWMY